ncbi:hypothetical protein EV714DRAFT_218263 [Schizophyllum commune]
MFSTALFVLGAVGLASATQVKYIKASATDPLNSQGNWTLHSIAPSTFILEDAPDATTSNVSAYLNGKQVKMDCPYDGLVAALLPVEGVDPKQYTFDFVKADAKLAEGAITDGWFEEDAIPGINYPDLKKIGNSNVSQEGFFEVVDDGDFDFPALSWIAQKPQNGQGYQIVIDYAHDAEWLLSARSNAAARRSPHVATLLHSARTRSSSPAPATTKPVGSSIPYPIDEANPPALLIPDAAEFTTMFKVKPVYAVDLELPDAVVVSKMYTMKLVQGEPLRNQTYLPRTLSKSPDALRDLPAQRTDSEQTVDSPFASGLNTPADVGNQTNPFDYAHRKVFGEDGEEPADQKMPALDTVHGRALGGKQSGSDTPRARVPSLNEAALRALAMERVESDASSSSVGGDSPLLETGEARDSIYSMPNTSISPALKGASPALPAQAEGVPPSVSFSVPDDTVQITAGPTASAVNIAPPDMAAVSSTRAVYAADDDADPFADPFSDAHEFVDSIMGEDAASGSTTANANLNVPNARVNLADSILDQGPVRKNDAADDDPFLPVSGATGATISANTDTFILSNSSVVDSTSSVGIPDMDSLDFIASLGIRPPAPSMTGLAAVAESESATLNPGMTTSMSLGAAAASLHNIANSAEANANTSIDDDAPLDSDDSFDSDASMYTTRDNNASLDYSRGGYTHVNNIDYELANDLDYALDYDVAPMPASFPVSSIYALDVQRLAVGFLKVLLFLPWCVAVGAVILLAPEYMEVVAFGAPEKEATSSFVDDAKSDDAKPNGADDSKADGSSWSSESVAGSASRATAPADGARTGSSTATSLASTLAAYLPTHVGLYPYTPRGIRRLAHWAEYALPHVAIFGAAVVGLIYVLGAYVDAMVCAAVVVGAVGVGVVRLGAAGGGVVANGREGSANGREEGIADVRPGEVDGEVVGGEGNGVDGIQGGQTARAARVGMDDAETVRVILKAYVMGREIPGMRRVGGGDDGFVWV